MAGGPPRHSRIDLDLALGRPPDPAQPLDGKPAPSASRVVLKPESTVKVVPLFAERPPSEISSDASDGLPADWPHALQLIRDVGARVRRERDFAQDIVKQSRSLIQRSIAQVEEAETRAETAEAEASEASLRADRAEERARLAEERAQQADDRALAARAGEEEAQMWLRRLYTSLQREFGSLDVDPR